jgi:hypothetical protein
MKRRCRCPLDASGRAAFLLPAAALVHSLKQAANRIATPFLWDRL